MSENLEDDVLNEEAFRVKGEHQGISILVPSGGRGGQSRTMGHREDVGVGSIYDGRGKTMFTKELGHLEC